MPMVETEAKEATLIAIFIFYSKSAGKQARLSFSDEFRHCNVVTFDGESWILLDFDMTGLLTRRIKCEDGFKFLQGLTVLKEVTATICVEIDSRAVTSWRPWWVRSCNEVSRYTSGVDIGFTFNPRHLYKKLIKYRNSKNYNILSLWRRKDREEIKSVKLMDV